MVNRQDLAVFFPEVDVSGDQKVGQAVKEGIVAFFGRNEEAT